MFCLTPRHISPYPLFPLFHYPLAINTTPYRTTSPAAPGTPVVELKRRRKPGVHNTHQSARQHSSEQRNRPIPGRRGQKPAAEPSDARAKPQMCSSNLNGRKGANHGARCRDRPITAQDPEGPAAPPREGRRLDPGAGPQPSSSVAAAFPYRVFCPSRWGGGPGSVCQRCRVSSWAVVEPLE